MCEHGHPQPARCALCRVREAMRAHPERYERRHHDAPTKSMPRPVWFDAIVEDTKGMDEQEADEYIEAFVASIRGARS